MLDLDPRVDLQEIVAPVLAHHELDGPGIPVVDRLCQSDGVPVQSSPRFLGEVGRRGDLDDLLVPALHRAVALVKMHDPAVVVGQDLDLDVARVFHQLLAKHAPVAERGRGLARREVEGGLHLVRGPDDAHAPAAASHGRLEDDWVPGLFGELGGLSGGGDGSL